MNNKQCKYGIFVIKTKIHEIELFYIYTGKILKTLELGDPNLDCIKEDGGYINIWFCVR